MKKIYEFFVVKRVFRDIFFCCAKIHSNKYHINLEGNFLNWWWKRIWCDYNWWSHWDDEEYDSILYLYRLILRTLFYAIKRLMCKMFHEKKVKSILFRNFLKFILIFEFPEQICKSLAKFLTINFILHALFCNKNYFST